MWYNFITVLVSFVRAARAINMTALTSFNDILEAARRVFSSATPEPEARTLTESLRVSGKLSLGVLKNYLPQLAQLAPSAEREHAIADMLRGMQDDGWDLTPLLPSLLTFITSTNMPYLRQTLTDIVCSLGGRVANSVEGVALGCLRNQVQDIRRNGARILLAISPWCNNSLRSRLDELVTQLESDPTLSNLELSEILKEASKICHSAADSAPPAGTTQPARMRLPNMENKRVLFAEDDEQIRSLIKSVLKNAHADVDAAADGFAAISFVDAAKNENKPYDLAVLDLRMPGENGIRVLAYLRKFFPPEQTPVIIMTAVKDKDLALTANQKYGIHSYLIKPVPLQDFYNRMGQAMTERGAAPA